ncbi:MAG TPA: hypothetical protein VGH03_14140 [Caulobacteraceae bacterium]|jgi:hypothetical protein
MSHDAAPAEQRDRGVPRQVVIGALGLAQIIGYGSSYCLLAVLAAPIAADTHWPLPWVVGAF